MALEGNMNKYLLMLCFSVSSTAVIAAGQTLSEKELDSVAAGGATATAIADATGVDAVVSTYTYSGPITSTPPAATGGSSGNLASALLGGTFGGGSAGPVPAPGSPQAQNGSTSHSTSSVNTNVVQVAPPAQGGNLAASLLQQMRFGR